jgi:type VI secretion system protein ImpE
MPETAQTVGALLRAGKLDPAIAAASTAVRRSPADPAARLLLAELLLLAGNLERAEIILDAAAQFDPKAAVAIAEFRQLLRAETARRQCGREGRVPEFLGEPSAALRSALAAAVALRGGDTAEAARHAAAAEDLRPRVPGVLTQQAGERPFDDFRDIDDLRASFFEVLTTTGKCFWIPTERVATIAFHPPRRPRDLAWRRATMTVIDGPEGEVYLPALYDCDRADLGDEFRLGRATDWIGEDGEPVRGIGQRVFLIGAEACGIMDLAALCFAP